jgi:nifR3 family TIM-barrel protein
MIKIGNVIISGYAALAPMASVGDRAFRTVCRENGASYTVGEMASAKGLLYESQKTKNLLSIKEDEHPAAVQLFGDNPEDMGIAAKETEKFGADIIDINMGCPVPKVAGSGSGAALMRDIKKAERIIKSVVENTSLPVTVKFRRGWDEQSANALEFAVMAEEAGAKAVAVHCRTKEQMYSFPVDFSIIGKIKRAVKIPVIGNGGIRCAEEAKKMFEETGCDLVMVGNGALGNPFIFREINALMGKGEILPLASTEEKMQVLKRQAELAVIDKGENVAIREMRKHAMWYVAGMRYAATFKRQASEMKTLGDLEEFCREVLRNKER